MQFGNQIRKIDKPIFMIGTGRNGSTLIGDLLALHLDLCWVSNYLAKFPAILNLSITDRVLRNHLWNLMGSSTNTNNKINPIKRLLPRQSEAYTFWNYYSELDFGKNFLANQYATSEQINNLYNAISKISQITGKPRFFSKLTGPPRLTFLQSVFPDAIFINIVRDFRSVLSSYLKVNYWKHGGGYVAPWWENILSESDREIWYADKRPEVLAALQIKNIVLQTSIESSDLIESQFLEIKYEDFLNTPGEMMNKIYTFSGLPNFPKTQKNIEMMNLYNNQIAGLYASDDTVMNILKPILSKYNYI